MNSKQRMLIFFGILFLVFSIFIVDQFSNIPKNDPLNQTNFVVVNDHIIIIELAVTEEERRRGLMGREKLADNNEFPGAITGMLFVFEEELKHSFWMKNMKISLDMIWIDSEGVVVHIEKNVQPCVNNPCEIFTPNNSALYVLEVNSGIADKLDIQQGTTIEISLNA